MWLGTFPGEQRDDGDAGRVVIVVVTQPQGDAAHLEDVERVEHLLQQQGEVRGDLHRHRVGPVQLPSGLYSAGGDPVNILEKCLQTSTVIQTRQTLKRLILRIPNVSVKQKNLLELLKNTKCHRIARRMVLNVTFVTYIKFR